MKTFFKTAALIGKYKSPEIAPALLRLAEFLRARGIRVLLDPLTAAHVGKSSYDVLPLEEVGRAADLAVVIGGDGTMLNIARTFAPYDVALVGINQGRLGFLTDLAMNDMLEAVGAILDGGFTTETRMLLQAQVISNARTVLDVVAFNDVSVNKGAEGTELLSILVTNNIIGESSRIGYGSAIAVVLLVISLAVIIPYLIATFRKERRA